MEHKTRKPGSIVLRQCLTGESLLVVLSALMVVIWILASGGDYLLVTGPLLFLLTLLTVTLMLRQFARNRDSSTICQAAIRNMATAFVRIDPESGEILDLNPAFLTLTGYSRGQCIGRQAQALIMRPDVSDERFLSLLSRVSRRGKGSLRLTLLAAGDQAIPLQAELTVAVDAWERQEICVFLRDQSEERRLEREVLARIRDQKVLLDSLPLGVSILQNRRLVQVNQRFLDLFGREEAEVIGKTTEVLFADRTAWDRFAEDVYCSIHKPGQSVTVEVEMIRKDGTPIWVRETGALLDSSEDGEKRFIWLAEDITEARKAVEMNRLAAEVFANSSEAIMVCSAENRIETVNPAFTRITGYRRDEVIGQKPQILASGRQDNEFYEDMWRALNDTGYWRGEIWNRRRNGEAYAEWLSIAALRDDMGNLNRYIAIFSDITTKKQEEEKVRYQASYDNLTALPNRNLFYDRLEHVLSVTDRKRCMCALLYIDLDGFKEVNDTLGHAEGDTLLKEGARRLRNSVRNSDTVARLGGDEFTIILSEIHSERDVEAVASSVLRSFREPFTLAGNQARISMSVGIAMYPVDARDKDDLIKFSDIAMYAAKRSGKNTIRRFHSDMLGHGAGRPIPISTGEKARRLAHKHKKAV